MIGSTWRLMWVMCLAFLHRLSATEFPTSQPTNAIYEVVTFDATMIVYNVKTSEFTPAVKRSFRDTVASVMVGVRSDDVSIKSLDVFTAPTRHLRERTLVSGVGSNDSEVSWSAFYSSQALEYTNVSSSIEDMTEKLQTSIDGGTFASTFFANSGSVFTGVAVELSNGTTIQTSSVMDHSPPPTSRPTVVPEPPFELTALQIAVIILGVLCLWGSCGLICAFYYSSNLRSTEHTVRRPYRQVIRAGAPVKNADAPSPLTTRRLQGQSRTGGGAVSEEEVAVELLSPTARAPPRSAAPPSVDTATPAQTERPGGATPMFVPEQSANEQSLCTAAPTHDTVDPSVFARVEVSGGELDEAEEEAAILVHVMTAFVDELDALNQCPPALKAYKLVPVVDKSGSGDGGPKMAIVWPDLAATRRWAEALIAEYRLLSFFKGTYCQALFAATSLPEHNIQSYSRENETFVNLRLTQLDPATGQRAPVPAAVVIDGLLGFHGNISKLRIYGNGLVRELQAIHADIMRYRGLLHGYVQQVIDENSARHAVVDSEQDDYNTQEQFFEPDVTVDGGEIANSQASAAPLKRSQLAPQTPAAPAAAELPSVLSATPGTPAPAPTQTHIQISVPSGRPRATSDSGAEGESDGEMTVSSLGTLSTVANAASKLKRKAKKAKKARETEEAAGAAQVEGSPSPSKSRPGLERLGHSTRNLHDKITTHALSPAVTPGADASAPPKSSGRRSSLSQTLIDQEKIREKNAAEKSALQAASAKPTAALASPGTARPPGISKTGSAILTPKHKKIDIVTATDRWKKAVATR